MTKDLKAQSKRLAARLEAIPSEIVAEIKPALIASANDLANVAKALAPEDKGDLIASIEVTAPGGMTPAYAQGGGKSQAQVNQAFVTVGNPDQCHGHLVEFGTDPHKSGGQFEGTDHPGTEAQPFLLPAIRLTQDRNKRRIGRAIGKAVRNAAKSGGGDA
ncbi:hypothetical protein CEW89_01620 [Celeribacter ethanolicus]|uniref:HK97 gp10 family phage protein n=1 Tax=Celeribacter ethanolicus TaxID=1758178 RepID=A0A291GHL0_9RHOB|nr:HK97 gp10 family phage protein [Celeribacter ethanolicus]ATG49648.1 hypothetical protein CEW89_01620 [Celeribacter ethanolicus]